MSRSNERLTIEFVREQFEKEGCKLLSSEYVNARTPLEYRCNCGEVSKIRYDNFRQGKRCSKCRYEKIARKRKHSIEYVTKAFHDGGCELLSSEYINGHTPLKYRCECGNIAHIRYNNFAQGQRCSKCRIRKISGENSPHYKPELTDEQRSIGRNYVEIREWRKAVFERDDYTCQKCTKRGNGELNAHHVLSYDVHKRKRYVTENGVTLCKKCHKEFHDNFGYGNNDFEQFTQWLLEDDNFPKEVALK